jgi:L-alanine-DL-glutamate epimerase-like enolase superfamily enzyme
VALTASTHLSLNAPNAPIQESVLAFHKTWYRDVVTEVPQVRNGMISVPAGPGLGLELHPGIDKRFKPTRRLNKS